MRDLVCVLKRILVFGGIVLVLDIAAFPLAAPSREVISHYRALHALYRQLDTVPPPRIVLVGGSEVAFGQNCRVLEEELNIPVVNTGTHAGLGLNMILSCVWPYLRGGDIVLLTPNYWYFYGGCDGSDPLFDFILAEPSTIANVTTIGQVRTITHTYAKRLSRLVKRYIVSSVHSAMGRDERHASARKEEKWLRRGYRGDIVFDGVRENENLPLKDWTTLSREKFDMAAVRRIEHFASSCREKGVEMRVLFPPIPREYYRENARELRTIEKELRRNLSHAVTRSIEQCTMERRYFYDTVYHLNGNGRRVRTAMMSAILKEILQTRRGRAEETRGESG
ncbi:MAG: hypothetical protein QHI48_10360 [Bacteroidota bacterium]|nr:hypothetical protein [Bacteroidota bacterium]